MPFVTPLLQDAPNTDNTGEYAGYQIRVKGDGRVQAVDAEGNTTMHRNVLNAKTWIDSGGAGGDGETSPTAPTLDSVDPASTPIDTPVQVTLTGTGFAEDSTVQADDGALVSAYVSGTEMTADIPGIATAGTLSITVTSGGEVSNAVSFEVTAA